MKVRNKIISAVCALSMAFSMVGAFAVNTSAATGAVIKAEVTKQPTSADKVVEVTLSYSGVDMTDPNMAGIASIGTGFKNAQLGDIIDTSYETSGFKSRNEVRGEDGDPITNFAFNFYNNTDVLISLTAEPKLKRDNSVMATVKFKLKDDITKDIELLPLGNEEIATNLNADGGQYADGPIYNVAKGNLTLDFSKAIINKTAEGPGINSIEVTSSVVGAVEVGQVFSVTATVNKTGTIDDSVAWSLEGKTSADTKIEVSPTDNKSATVTIGNDEKAKSIKVVATSVADSTVKGELNVTINQPKDLTMTVAKATGTGSFNAFNVNVKASAASALTKPFDVIVQGYDANGAPVGYAIYKGISNANIPAEGYNFTAMLGGATEVKAWAVIDADYAADYLGTVVANPVSTDSNITK